MCYSDSESFSYRFRNKTKWETQGSSLDQHLKTRRMGEQWFCGEGGEDSRVSGGVSAAATLDSAWMYFVLVALLHECVFALVLPGEGNSN